MKAQVVHVKIKEGTYDSFKNCLNRWAEECGKPMEGVKQIITCFEPIDKNRCTVIVMMDSAETLSRFSEDESSLSLFEEAKEYFKDSVYFYPAEVETISLT